MSTCYGKADMAKRDDVTVKLDAEVVRLAKIVAAYRDTSVAEYLSEVLMPVVQRDLEQEQARTKSRTTAGARGDGTAFANERLPIR
jgi:hypothetical protein